MPTTFLVVANNVAGTLASSMDDSQTTVPLLDGTTFPAVFPYEVTIEGEIIRVNGKTVNTLTPVVRAQEGTAAAAHGSGAPVELLVTAKHVSDLDTAVNAAETDIVNHAAAADPHTAYQRESERAAANGYASLGADILVPQEQLGTGAQDGTKFLRDDGTWQTAPGGGSALTLTTVEVSLGSAARRAGRFTITGAGLTTGKPVLIQQADGPYTGKGSRADEAEMDVITVTGKVFDATTIECFWSAAYKGPVKGNFKFDYAVSA